jgi:signal transduction histidine kinase
VATRALILVTALLGGLLGVWFISGWSDVRARQAETRAAPVRAAEDKANELARELRSQLDALLAHETSRPYFHYQNLFHDPRASQGKSVAPSPLAAGPDEPLVLGYFQIDAQGKATTPTVNDDVPSLSEPTHLAEHQAFRDDVARELAGPLAPGRTQIASSWTVQVDPSTYTQNFVPNQVYVQAPITLAQRAATITVSALEWRTLAFAGAPALVAVREVLTPDGALSQGFVVDGKAVTAWLASHAGDLVATLKAGDGAHAIAPGWQVSVAPSPRAVSAAAASAHAIARGFVLRFAGVGVLGALLAAMLVVLVARAEKLARERSEFAAAAAHELRTPLAGLQLYGDMLADGLGDPDKARDYAKRMAEEAARLGRVVSNVLGFSQLERGNLSVDAQVGSLGDALRDLADRAQPALDRAGAALDLDASPELRARFDRDALARIVGNLLDNAEKYGRAAADRTITLAARDAGDTVEIVVSDHGPGVRDLADLFRPFSRGVTADGPAGLGLGLALSRSLARAMGGELRYREAAGGGAAFVLQLPRA